MTEQWISEEKPRRAYSYQEAADLLGCDHHWVRMMTSRGRFDIVERVEVKPNVLKVFIDADQVDAYYDERRRRVPLKAKLTPEEMERFRREFPNAVLR